MDVVDAATRSRMMSGIRGKNTGPEITIRHLLHRRGFRFRLHARELPGKPDILLPRYRAAVFVHGCFWHGHDCPLFRLPASRPVFWKQKIDRNRSNDDRASAALRNAGWRLATIWECALRGPGKDAERLADALAEWIQSDKKSWEARR